MSDKKHIDRLFQERFKDFEATPSDAVWKNIEAELTKDKKKRRIIPIWWQYAGVAALLALLLTVGGTYFFNTNKNTPIKIVDTEDNQTRSSNTKSDIKIAVENTSSNKNNLENDAQNDARVVSNNTNSSKTSTITTSSNSVSNTKKENLQTNSASLNEKSNVKNLNTSAVASNSEEINNPLNNSTIAKTEENNTKIAVENNETLINSEKAKTILNNVSKDASNIAKTEEKNKNTLTIEEALDETKDKIEKEKHTNKWRITPNAAPVYFSSLGEGSSIGEQFNNNSKTGEVNMSYGINASYVVNDKIKIRSGINKVNLGYNTNDVVIYQSFGSSSSSSISALENVNISASNTPSDISIISGETISARPEAFATTNSSISQAFAYIEIPLEVQYVLVNTKLGVNLIGGFSSFFLSDNKVYSETENGSRTLLGEANNINNVSYSANFGVGVNYQISKKIDLNLEPMFKYQINTFNNTSGNFTPFFIGVYTGFAIKF
ncbi:hypothetical protein ACFQ1R_10860 [Mariniflexile jejuense]|uniref:Outer membrane protein beta-barrel domain-containing protein n=1 Tax=Mariniflexile jejuense TaxID=1173582 RepID=A0ABW3JJF0_9FLAO